MNKKAIIVLITFMILLTGCNASVPVRQPLASTTDIELIANQIDQLMRKMEVSYFSGDILVAQNGKVIIRKWYGFANKENNILNTINTKFAIGSMTKAFTAMAIMLLQEQGQLNVNDSICKYISDCPATWQPITLHQLLTHTSGIKDYVELYKIMIDPCKEYKLGEFIALLKDLPLDFRPGSQFHYSNSGYYLLGIVIEKVSSESYEEYIQKYLFQPLGMSESGYDRINTTILNRASGYSWDGQEIINAYCWDISQKYAAMGLYSTVDDLYKWDQSLYTTQLVSKDTLNMIFTSYISVPKDSDRGAFGKDAWYGYGWIILHRYGHRVIEHPGQVNGFTSTITRYPDDQFTIIILANRDQSIEDYIVPEDISAKIESIIFENKK